MPYFNCFSSGVLPGAAVVFLTTGALSGLLLLLSFLAPLLWLIILNAVLLLRSSSFPPTICTQVGRGERFWEGRWGVRGFEVMRGQGSRQGFAVGVLRRPWSGVEHGCHMAVRCECTLFACGMYSFCACVRLLHVGLQSDREPLWLQAVVCTFFCTYACLVGCGAYPSVEEGGFPREFVVSHA